MKSKIIINASIVLFTLFVFLNSYSIIAPGQVGVNVFLGKIRGNLLYPGFHLVAPVSLTHRMTSKFNQLTVDSSVLSKDNLNLQVEVTLLYKIRPDKYTFVYSNFGDSVYDFNKALIIPSIHSAIREGCSEMEWDNISMHRDILKNEIAKNLKSVLHDKGFIISNVLINNIQPPSKIKEAVMAKLKTQQEVTQMNFEKQKATKEAQIKIIEANGIAKSQEIIQKKLTPLYVQYYAIQTYKNLASSKNTTFVIMPTNPKGAGLPLILDAKKETQ
jgi:regulator of protease activity HflC (stomatin/prohibitin superfamily)